ncbi:hypothetical protein BBD41_09665 [Paenibacillus ihbetae]|uniref:DUF4007 domain-containing protein n=1 Tax=Paenibacillus ihbetae TaxID=1870820 RepID=A0A1B2DYR5_9BACL|nr:DUF4007 family protein [Paenibacillus ihbetae]ANY72831.1 hypothetical protein BBD41_09665 [Paenibacillus ihbetae]
MKFGHHQSFYLRVNWLSKAMKMTQNDARFFFDEFAFEKIGLGKNMVKSLRYWVVATNVMEEEKNEQRQSIHRLTPFGKLLSKYDRFTRFPLTAAVLHVNLAFNKELSPTWYWYFNEFNQRAASNEDLLTALNDWASIHLNRRVSIHTLKRDIDCLKQMYTARTQNDDDPEDVVASPLSGLDLLYESRDQFIKRTPNLSQLDLDALYFTLLRYCELHQVNSVTLEEVLVKPLLWGKLFHLSSNQILEVMQTLQANSDFPVNLVRTNQLNILNIDPQDPYAFLEKAYERKAGF